MKPLSTVLLLASLALNATLAYVALTGRARLADTAAADPALSALGAQPAASPGPAPIDPATWSKLQTDDLPALVTRLRAAGFPPDVIRAMLNGLLTEQFAARRRALDPDSANRPFWKDRAPDLKLQLAQFQLYREQEKPSAPSSAPTPATPIPSPSPASARASATSRPTKWTPPNSSSRTTTKSARSSTIPKAR